MSDRGIPTDPSRMNGYGSHTFSLWNDQGERFWVKFHFKTQQGHEWFSNEEAEKLFPAGWNELKPYLRMTRQPNR